MRVCGFCGYYTARRDCDVCSGERGPHPWDTYWGQVARDESMAEAAGQVDHSIWHGSKGIPTPWDDDTYWLQDIEAVQSDGSIVELPKCERCGLPRATDTCPGCCGVLDSTPVVAGGKGGIWSDIVDDGQRSENWGAGRAGKKPIHPEVHREAWLQGRRSRMNLVPSTPRPDNSWGEWNQEPWRRVVRNGRVLAIDADNTVVVDPSTGEVILRVIEGGEQVA